MAVLCVKRSVKPAGRFEAKEAGHGAGYVHGATHGADKKARSGKVEMATDGLSSKVINPPDRSVKKALARSSPAENKGYSQ